MNSVKDLSKEEYINYLSKFLDAEILKKFNFDKEVCIFHNTRGNITKCEKLATTDHGFCTTHKNTLQSKNSKKIFEEFLEDLQKSKASGTLQNLKDEIENINEEEEGNEDEVEATEEDVKEEQSEEESSSEEEDSSKNHKYPNKILNNHKESNNKDSSSESSSEDEESDEESSSESEEEKITVYKNKWGNYEDKNTNIVFDRKTGNAIGYQKSNGEIYSLTPKHVKICTRNGWSYNLPKSVYSKKNKYSD